MREDDTLKIRFRVPVRGTERAFHVSARVEGFFSGGMGVRFLEPDVSTLVALQDVASRAEKARREARDSAARSAAWGGNGEADPVDTRQAFTRCRKILSEYLTAHLQALFEAAGEKARALQPDGGAEQIEKLRRELPSAFQRSLLGQLDELRRPGAWPEAYEDDQTQSFSDWLTIKEMVEKATVRVGDDRVHVERCLSYLVKAYVDEDGNPLGPVGLCTTFHGALEPLRLGRRTRRILLEAFDETVLAHLGTLYQRLHRVFDEYGVPPAVRL